MESIIIKNIVQHYTKLHFTMLQLYNTLRRIYIVDGFEEAYTYIEEIEQTLAASLRSYSTNKQHHSLTQELHSIFLANLYTYITIQSQFKPESTLPILQGILTNPIIQSPIPYQSKLSEFMQQTHPFLLGHSSDQYLLQPKSLRALTLYHICSIKFKEKEYVVCMENCLNIVRQFISEYYILEKRLERDVLQEGLMEELQEMLYYTFLMLAYCEKKVNGEGKGFNMYLEAGKRILKDREDVMSLTGGSHMSKKNTIETSQSSTFHSPMTPSKSTTDKQNSKSLTTASMKKPIKTPSSAATGTAKTTPKLSRYSSEQLLN